MLETSCPQWLGNSTDLLTGGRHGSPNEWYSFQCAICQHAFGIRGLPFASEGMVMGGQFFLRNYRDGISVHFKNVRAGFFIRVCTHLWIYEPLLWISWSVFNKSLQKNPGTLGCGFNYAKDVQPSKNQLLRWFKTCPSYHPQSSSRSSRGPSNPSLAMEGRLL